MTIRERFNSLFGLSKAEPAKDPEPPMGPSQYFYFNNFPGSGWFGQKTWRSFVPTQPLYVNHNELRKQAEKAHIESTHCQSIVSRIADLTIASGVRMESTPAYEILDPEDKIYDEPTRQKWNRNHEARFALWAESKEASADGRSTFYRLQHFAKSQKIVVGEYFFIVRYMDDPTRMSPIALQGIRPEQVRNPSKKEDLDAIQKRGNTVREGIELDINGNPVAYYVWGPMDYVRIPKRSADGKRIFMIHGFEKKKEGQVRGISDLSGILHDLAKMTDYTVAELDAAIANAIIAMAVIPGPSAPSSRALSGVQKKSEYQPTDPVVERSIKQGRVKEGGIVVQTLAAGEKLESFDTKRPNVNFSNFMSATMKYLAGSRGIPVEVVEMSFNANYSASRASLKLCWVRIELERQGEIDDLNKPVHEAWFREEVKSGNIKAEGFGKSAVITHAWLKTDWIGESAPDIDPLKTANAREKNIAMGLTTHEREAAAHNGSEFADNVKRLKIENEELSDANGGQSATAQPPTQPPGPGEFDANGDEIDDNGNAILDDPGSADNATE